MNSFLTNVNSLFLIIMGALIILMQAEFEFLEAGARVSSVELSVVLSVEKMSVEKNVTLNSTIFNTDLLKKKFKIVLGRLGYVFLNVMINLKTFFSYSFSTNVNKSSQKTISISIS